MAVTLFGIPNCDTVKKARTWLDAQGVAYDFHDYKKAGVDEGQLRGWVDRLGWETVLNRKGTTFRKLPEETRADLDAEKAVRIMLAHPSAIKRPIVVTGGEVRAGFDSDAYAGLFPGR
ncbi:ArsC family transcriptional regulator [Sphingomonas sp. Leaf339]|uniref:ArsC family reductase n=1 Tax=Sphingomonas sp. Leaf339 TaxID=1736343 RepID=UPI0006F20A9D|nr:ArsC family reductase [Sphingomonas sp. Leaf339]KQU53164.1 ArsC family transcriptional regulator [Sphingomonas sp. Leaf339]